jgi:hypothetical protein
MTLTITQISHFVGDRKRSRGQKGTEAGHPRSLRNATPPSWGTEEEQVGEFVANPLSSERRGWRRRRRGRRRRRERRERWRRRRRKEESRASLPHLPVYFYHQR